MTTRTLPAPPKPPALKSDGLLDGFRAAYERLMASARFRDFAVRFPLTRPLARRRASALFDLCAGFTYSQVLLACVRLELFDRLAPGPRDAASLAVDTGLTAEAMQRLLRAAVSLRLVSKRSGGRYGLGDLGAAIVGEPGIAAIVEHHAMVYADLTDPLALLRDARADTALARFWPYADRNRPHDELSAERLARYSALMSATQPMVTKEVLSAYAMDGHRRVLDVGGGEGAFLCACGARYPNLELTLFDLPVVAELARTRFDQAGLGARARAVGGDFRGDALPGGADLVTLIRVLFDHDDDSARSILRAARAALPAGGTVLVAEPVACTDSVGPVVDAYFGFYLLAMGRGRTRSFDEHAGLLEDAGFARVRSHATRMPMQAGVITAKAA